MSQCGFSSGFSKGSLLHQVYCACMSLSSAAPFSVWGGGECVLQHSLGGSLRGAVGLLVLWLHQQPLHSSGARVALPSSVPPPGQHVAKQRASVLIRTQVSSLRHLHSRRFFQPSQEAIHSQMRAWKQAWCHLAIITYLLIPSPLL